MVIPLALVLALLVGGSIAVWRFWPDATIAAPDPTVGVSASTAAPSPTESSAAAPTETPSPSSTTDTTPSAKPASGAAARALKNCRERVRAADEVLGEAQVGISHWSDHVDAERREDRNEISEAKKAKIFKDTRLKGPGDQKRYAAAIRRYERLDASCGPAKGADEKIAASLEKCQDRLKAQKAVLKAADPTMKDWKQHLADMQRSRELHVKNAQGIWLKAYEAAPRHLKPYERAVKRFDAPDC